MINEKDSHIPLPLIMFTCTVLHHALQEWQINKGVHQKASMPKLNVDRPDSRISFNDRNQGGKIASCCTVLGCKLLTLPGVADIYTLLMNTLKTLPESYQQWVNHNTVATVKRQIEQGENPMPAVVTSVEVTGVNNAILLNYLASEVALEKPAIGDTDATILIDNNCTADKLYFGMAWVTGN
jgi:hypothetical protein